MLLYVYRLDTEYGDGTMIVRAKTKRKADKLVEENDKVGQLCSWVFQFSQKLDSKKYKTEKLLHYQTFIE